MHRLLYCVPIVDALFLLAFSGAAYHHTGATWLLYAIYITASMALFGLFTSIATWPKYIGDTIEFHARCIRDKGLNSPIEIKHPRVLHYPTDVGL